MAEFPEMKGFSHRNLKYIRQWVLFWNNEQSIGLQAVAQLTQIPWGHNQVIITQYKNTQEGLYYVKNTIEHGWSRSVLTHQIESNLWQREGKAISNFSRTLPSLHSDLAHQTLKDPYIFDFLSLTKEYNEKELEQGLVDHIIQFLLELKNVDFEPENIGKLNFYIKAVDEQLRQEGDAPTIGLLLCKNRDKIVVEYALSNVHKPIGISEYQITKSLPEKFKSSLPTVEELEAELSGNMYKK